MTRSLWTLAMLPVVIFAMLSSAFGEDDEHRSSKAARAPVPDLSVPKPAYDNGSASDVTATVDALEEQRSKLDKKSGNVSLSVSGTVSQQFIVTPK